MATVGVSKAESPVSGFEQLPLVCDFKTAGFEHGCAFRRCKEFDQSTNGLLVFACCKHSRRERRAALKLPRQRADELGTGDRQKLRDLLN